MFTMCLCVYFDIYVFLPTSQSHVANIFSIWKQSSVRLIACKYDLGIFPSAKARDDLPEMTSSRSMSFSPSLKSSSMFSICVPAFLRWELHHAVNVCTKVQEHHKHGEYLESEPCFSDFYHNKSALNERRLNSMDRKEGRGGDVDKTGNSTRGGDRCYNTMSIHKWDRCGLNKANKICFKV